MYLYHKSIKKWTTLETNVNMGPSKTKEFYLHKHIHKLIQGNRKLASNNRLITTKNTTSVFADDVWVKKRFTICLRSQDTNRSNTTCLMWKGTECRWMKEIWNTLAHDSIKQLYRRRLDQEQEEFRFGSESVRVGWNKDYQN